MVALEIKKALQELAISCEVISSAEKCKHCPLKDICFDDYSIVDIASKADINAITKMMNMAEMIDEQREEREKTEEQRRWEHDADSWLDRRKEI